MKPSPKTKYLCDEDKKRVKRIKLHEKNVTSYLVKEAELTKERLKLLREGKTKEEILQMIPKTKSKLAKTQSYAFNTRCPSPMIQPKEASHYNTYLIVYVFSPRSSI
jgi:hypothetical protein